MELKEKEIKQSKPVQRLCNEIQLFELCELERCIFKKGRFCTDEELLIRFEQISDKEDAPALINESEESMDGEEWHGTDFDEEYSEAEPSGEENDWKDE